MGANVRFPALLCLCALLLLTLLLSGRVPHRAFPGSALLCTFCLLVFHALAYVVLAGTTAESAGYWSLYRWGMIISGAAAVVMALDFNRAHERLDGACLAISSLCIAMAIGGTLRNHLTKDWGSFLHESTLTLICNGIVLLTAGLMTLGSLTANLPLADAVVRAAFGGYLVLRAALVEFGFAQGAVRNRAAWAALNGWLPALPGILCFGLLCVFLATQQREGARQEIRGQLVAHTAQGDSFSIAARRLR